MRIYPNRFTPQPAHFAGLIFYPYAHINAILLKKLTADEKICAKIFKPG